VGETTIEWAHWTLNPWRGCTKATWVDAAGKTRMHPGCEHCYAEKDMSVQLHGIKWGKGQARRPKAESGWKEPLRWARAAAAAGERHRVFCASLSDLLDNEGLPTMRERLWETIRRTAMVHRGGPYHGLSITSAHMLNFTALPGLDWLLLTKRPENWRLIPEDVRPLVWLGTSVSDQETADEWVPRLLQADGFRYRFLSVEPLLGPVDFRLYLPCPACGGEGSVPVPGGGKACGACYEVAQGSPRGFIPGSRERGPFIDWVIVGGESGPKARPCNVEWVRSIVDQSLEAGVPCFMKQMGSVWASEHGAMSEVLTDEGDVVLRPDHKGGDWKNWPEDLRVRQFPGEVS
jgi:protein gp37